MVAIRYTRNLFLRGVCVVYLFAFLSFYVQIPGLYGNKGILPARLQLDGAKSKTLSARIHNKPTLLWLAPYIGLDTEYMMDVLAIMGAFLAFTGFISQKFCTVPTFAGLWSLYFSLYQVGQIFMWFQWDTLLLEAGLLSVLAAPLTPQSRQRRLAKSDVPSDTVTLWLVRWLLFRFLFFSGIVKLLSACPKWWDLSALSIHFESMPLPSPLAWYAHHLPKWFLKTTTVYTQVCEIGLPFLFFVPIRSVRITGFFIQLFLQVNIILTGNFNFVNLLVLTLMISLLDDECFLKKSKKQAAASKFNILGALVNIAIHGGVLYGVYVLYGIKVVNGSQLDAKIMFTKDQFEKTLIKGIPFIIYYAVASLGVTIMRAIIVSAFETTGQLKKLTTVVTTLLYSIAAVFIFTISTVPLFSLHPTTNSTINPVIKDLYHKAEPYKVVNEYGLFRRITGVNGRPEVILEGSNNIEGPWQEYSFLYKPGNINNSLPFTAPYSPRLDWQLWFASLGTYHQQPWLMSFAYRILTGQPEVLQLIDKAHSPFNKQPPKYIRASLYHYKYTPWSERWQTSWWTREKVGEYFPVFSRDHGPLLDYLRSIKILPDLGKDVKSTVNPIVKLILDNIRYFTSQLEASIFLWSIFSAGLAIIATTGRSK